MSPKAALAIATLTAALTLSFGAAVLGGQARGGGFSQPDAIAFDDHAGWVSLFDGQSLKDWDGNGRTMSLFIDDDPTMAAARGVIALQVENSGKVSFRNLWLKNLQYGRRFL